MSPWSGRASKLGSQSDDSKKLPNSLDGYEESSDDRESAIALMVFDA